jgi:hypothetical protein
MSAFNVSIPKIPSYTMPRPTMPSQGNSGGVQAVSRTATAVEHTAAAMAKEYRQSEIMGHLAGRPGQAAVARESMSSATRTSTIAGAFGTAVDLGANIYEHGFAEGSARTVAGNAAAGSGAAFAAMALSGAHPVARMVGIGASAVGADVYMDMFSDEVSAGTARGFDIYSANQAAGGSLNDGIRQGLQENNPFAGEGSWWEKAADVPWAFGRQLGMDAAQLWSGASDYLGLTAGEGAGASAEVNPMIPELAARGGLWVGIETKTAAGVEGYDHMSPWAPGHANVVIFGQDEGAQMSRFETFGAWPAGTADNFWPSGTGDIRTNDLRDFPSAENYPFFHAEQITPDGYDRLRGVVEGFGDYQFYNPNCVTFAKEAYNAAVGEQTFSESTSSWGIDAPYLLGEQINSMVDDQPWSGPTSWSSTESAGDYGIGSYSGGMDTLDSMSWGASSEPVGYSMGDEI